MVVEYKLTSTFGGVLSCLSMSVRETTRRKGKRSAMLEEVSQAINVASTLIRAGIFVQRAMAHVQQKIGDHFIRGVGPSLQRYTCMIPHRAYTHAVGPQRGCVAVNDGGYRC